MSTKSSIFLTKDNEHCYHETAMQHKDGFTIVLELDKRNARLVLNDEDDIVIEIDPGSELYEQLNQLKDVKRKKATIEVYEPFVNREIDSKIDPMGKLSSAIEALNNRFIKELRDKLESQIRDRLTRLGYTFINKEEEINFYKQRLSMVVKQENGYDETFLYLDYDLPTRQLLACWNDRTKVEFTDTGIKVTTNL